VTDEYSVTVRREIAAPTEDLFNAWLDAQSLGSWLRPSGIRETRFRDSIVTVTFQPSSNNSTAVEIHQVGLPDEEARASHHAGSSDVLRELGRTTHAKMRAES
jgi:uncharacterized protein YndB with AHSA1/START domain